ncbi:MAG: beta-ketoacyl-[acyl-carrier-protein] synthase II [Proteobacteria bacterium]|nr:MAG: beta-ketoacyl-[acyl-carrier-protein] synthase II [Pseudomonadota bacterium]
MQGHAGRRRAVVTGLGCVTPLGTDVAATWARALAGESGVGALRRFDATSLPSRIAAECDPGAGPRGVPAKEARRLDRATLLALAAAEEAIADAGLDANAADPERVGVVVGTSIGGIGTLLDAHDVLRERGPRRLSPFVVPMSLPNMTAAFVSMHGGWRGPIGCPVGACASGAQALGAAARLIERGEADVVLAGGTEAAILPLVLAGFAAMRALSVRNDDPSRASRPFDRARDGFVIGEGAGVLVLEAESSARARGARIRAVWLGYGEAADATHPASPPQDAHGARRAIERALADAGLAPADVGYVNAHATSTPAGDRAEALALRAALGAHADRVPVSATKSMTGHLLGAAGAVEAILCVRALETGELPPTTNLDDPDPDCALDHVAHKARPHAARVALSNAFGFGGVNASLLLGRAE